MASTQVCFAILVSAVVYDLIEPSAAHAQTGCTQPGCYGPVQEEPGFNEKGGYMQVSHEAIVNHFGGNLIVSSEDVSLASLGGFKLFFKRTHNSSKTFHPPPLVATENDSPLGFGWTSHYGILFLPGASGSTAPELVDNSGGRELFYPHDHLSSSIVPASGNNPRFISASMSILRKISNNEYELYQKNGLRLTLSRLSQYSSFLVTTNRSQRTGLRKRPTTAILIVSTFLEQFPELVLSRT